MSTLTTSTGTGKITNQEIRVPKYGAWWAEVTLDQGDVLPSGQATIKTADLTLVGGVRRAAFDAPGKPRAVIFGGLGWRSPISRPLSFQSAGGVRLSTVLTALATGAGETIAQPTDKTIGDYYEVVASRAGEPVRYADALASLVRAGYCPPWRVDPDGVTRFGSRTSVQVSARATRLPSDETGRRTYGADAPAQFLPGGVVDGVTIARTVIRETAGKLEIDVYPDEPESPPTVRESVRRILADLLGDMVRTYVVAVVHADKTMDLVPSPESPHYPELKNIEQWILGGVVYNPQPGDEVLVLRRDGRNTKPIAFAFRLGEGPFPGLARLADTVQVLLPPAVFSGQIGGTPATGVITFVAGQTVGNISSASARAGAKT